MKKLFLSLTIVVLATIGSFAQLQENPVNDLIKSPLRRMIVNSEDGKDTTYFSYVSNGFRYEEHSLMMLISKVTYSSDTIPTSISRVGRYGLNLKDSIGNKTVGDIMQEMNSPANTAKTLRILKHIIRKQLR